ncbi:MAG: helix-turn-helix domain-containing protein [Hyphomonas sp.]|nr:helix-turn-helix domain-containing protein [Hyphomonas sp.]
MTVKEVASYYRVSPATIWRWQKKVPDFPHPFNVGENSTRWDRRQIEEYHRRQMESAQR